MEEIRGQKPISTPNYDWVPLAQWLAVVTMSFEHSIKYLIPESVLAPWALSLGRIAFPMFAGMVAWHLVHNTRSPEKYGLRLLLIGLASQFPYAFVVSPSILNVCFTLSLGLFAVLAMDGLSGQVWRIAGAVSITLVAALISPFMEYQILGLLFVPAFVHAFRNPGNPASFIPALALGIAINGGDPLYMVISFAATLALLLCPVVRPPLMAVPIIPRWLRLSWYPLHFAMIALLISPISQGLLYEFNN